jgi:hypothetical protein
MVPRCMTDATILYTLTFSSAVKPKTSMQFWKRCSCQLWPTNLRKSTSQ